MVSQTNVKIKKTYIFVIHATYRENLSESEVIAKLRYSQRDINHQLWLQFHHVNNKVTIRILIRVARVQTFLLTWQHKETFLIANFSDTVMTRQVSWDSMLNIFASYWCKYTLLSILTAYRQLTRNFSMFVAQVCLHHFYCRSYATHNRAPETTHRKLFKRDVYNSSQVIARLHEC